MHPKPIHWLHLSDLHFGAPGAEVLNQVMSEFWEWLSKAKEIAPGAIDLLLISGDVAYSGAVSEYALADEFLNDLCRRLGDPAVICVPGNHDLARPQSPRGRLECGAFKDYAQRTGDLQDRTDLDRDLWGPGAKASIVTPLFEGYLGWASKWVNKLKSRGIKVHNSYFPGDLCVELNLNDTFPLLVVGLNSAWLQYNGDDFERKLSIPLPQFQAALPPGTTHNPLAIFQSGQRTILMMHHPPSWLSENARKTFYEDIFRPDRFDLCLFGHMHGARAEVLQIDGGRKWIQFQSPSLCGLEHYGRNDEIRSFGFTIGSLTRDGEIRVWPYVRALRGGQPTFLLDSSFVMKNNEGTQIREKDPPGCPGSITPAAPRARGSRQTSEGTVLRGVLSDAGSSQATIDRSYEEMTAMARSTAPSLKIELMRGDSTGDFTFFIHRGRDRAWSSLLQQTLQIAVQIAVTQSAAMVLHVEHEAIRSVQAGPWRGGGIEYANAMSSSLIKSHILLTSEAYKHLRSFLCDREAIGELLTLIPQGSATPERRDLEIKRTMIAPPQRAESVAHADDWEFHEVYNLCVRGSMGNLLLGSNLVPAGQISIGPNKRSWEKQLEQDLVQAERVCLVGVTHEGLHLSLNRALEIRESQGRDFWKEIRVVFLDPRLLEKILDYRTEKMGSAAAAKYRQVRWGGSVKNVREFLISRGEDVGRRWECHQYNYPLPFEAQRYIDGCGKSMIRMISLLPNKEPGGGYHIETADGNPLHDQLSIAIDAIVQTATPIVEFNIYGHAGEHDTFGLIGVVGQREWREFKPPEGGRPCYPVSLIMLHSRVGDLHQVLLQKRTIFNTGGDFDLYSLISGKVNDEDCNQGFFSDSYRTLGYEVSRTGDDMLRQQLSIQFATEMNLEIGKPVSLDLMESMWRNTASRELYAELGLEVKPESDRLKPYPCPHLLPRGEFDLYVNLYTLEISPEETKYIKEVRPNACLEFFGAKRLQEYNDNTTHAENTPPPARTAPRGRKGGTAEAPPSAEVSEVNQLNHFLHINFENVILPLLDKLGVQ